MYFPAPIQSLLMSTTPYAGSVFNVIQWKQIPYESNPKGQIRRDKATIVGSSSSIITLLLLLLLLFIIIMINNFIKAVPNERTEIIIMFE